MNTLTIRKVPDEVHRALKARARANGRSTEAEVRALLEEIAKPRRTLLDVAAEFKAKVGTVELDLRREKTTRVRGADFK